MTCTEKGPVSLGLFGLTALVFGMMVGAGIFNLPQNMAADASLGAVIISWIVTAVAMLLLVSTLKTLADRRPDLDAGIYQYAQAGWGRYVGFNVAWGYWLSACFANVAYAVMLCDAFGAFFPELLQGNWTKVIFGSVFIWIMYAVISCGMQSGKVIAVAMSIVKVVAIAVIVVLLATGVDMKLFTADVWSTATLNTGIFEQVKSTMLVTLWCFIGIEGAVVMSSRASRPEDVGRAGVTGFFAAWILYLLVSVLCFGIMSQSRLAGLDNPSVAYVLRDAIGSWAYYFVIVAVILSLLGGWVSWTLICAQVPHQGARVGVFPKSFLRQNSKEIPMHALLVSSVIMQAFLLVVALAEDVYLTALSVTGMMVLPAYLFSGLYLWKLTRHDHIHLGPLTRRRNMRFRLEAVGTTVCCLWMLYSGGWDMLAATALFYLCGLGYYIKARHEAGCCNFLSPKEWWAVAILTVAAVFALVIFISPLITE